MDSKITPFPMLSMERMEGIRTSSEIALSTKHPTYQVTGSDPPREDPDVQED